MYVFTNSSSSFRSSHEAKCSKHYNFEVIAHKKISYIILKQIFQSKISTLEVFQLATQ